MTNSKDLIGQNVPADEITGEPCEISEGRRFTLTKRGLAALTVYLTLALSGLTQASAQDADAAAGAVGEGGSDGAGSVGHADWSADWAGDAEIRQIMIDSRARRPRPIEGIIRKRSIEELYMDDDTAWFLSSFGRLDFNDFVLDSPYDYLMEQEERLRRGGGY